MAKAYSGLEGLDEKRIALLQEFEKRLGVSVLQLSLLHQALTHTSYANESKQQGVQHNERLEFLGDAVLELVVSSYLYEHFPELPEGELTKIRAQVVCEPTLARKAFDLNIGHYLLLGRGEEASGGRERVSILADAFEAVIGAIYLQAGLVAVTEFILRHISADLQIVARGDAVKEDYKTLLQELVQRQGECKIEYEVIGETGPDHDKLFQVTVTIKGRQLGSGNGKSKKEAEQQAAKIALQTLQKAK